MLHYEDDGVRLEVSDDGRGMAADGSGFGLIGLRERAARLGGSVDVESAPTRGTTVRMVVPA